MRKKQIKNQINSEVEIMDAQKTGKFISQLRKEKNLTQLQLAELLKVSDKAVSRWETGRGFPDIGSIEDIAGTLGVSIAELMKGERIETPITKNTVDDIAKDGITLTKSFMKKKKLAYLFIGFIISLLLLTLAVVHINSPVYLTDPTDIIRIETLSDGKLAAVLSKDVAGYELQQLSEQDDEQNFVFISCYRTLFSKLTKKTGETLILLGDKDSTDAVYYYPTNSSDKLLYARDSASVNKNGSGGVQTLPRLIYNYWIILGSSLSVIGIAAYVVLRKKRFAMPVLKCALVPVSLTLGTALCIAGNSGEIFNAPYYLTGIILSGVLIYTLLYLITINLRNRDSKKTDNKN